MSGILFKEESYAIIGACMEVHNYMGIGFKEILYKDALEIEFSKACIPYKREVQFHVSYKGYRLPHSFVTDFVIFNSILLEIKAAPVFIDAFIAQTLNYVKASGFISRHCHQLRRKIT